MDKAQAIHTFWSGFGLPAYDENTVPDNAPLPYITYGVQTASIDETVYPSASIWYRGKSWEAISKKADEIYEAIKRAPQTQKVDGGRMFITPGTPFAQRMSDEDDSIRRILIQVNIEFFTN